jgi:predicted permease
VNIANLLLARGAERQRKISIRIALGCGAGRLIREVLVESLLLSAAGAILGLLLAQWGARLIAHFLDSYLDLTPDIKVLAFTSGAAILTAIASAIVPALRAVRYGPQSALKAKAGSSANGGRLRLGKALVIGQVGISLVVLAGAGLLVTTFWKLYSLDPGFRQDGVILAAVGIPDGKGPGVYPQILERLRAIPGVESASISNVFPVCHCQWRGGLEIEGATLPSGQSAVVNLNEVSDGYFETLGTRIVAGRAFDVHDTKSSPRVAVINEVAARRYFSGANPLGRRIRISQSRLGDPAEIVGIVEDTKYGGLRDNVPPTIYSAWSQHGVPAPLTKFELRASGGNAAALIPGAKAAIAQIDPRIAIEFTTLADQVEDSISRERLLAVLSGLFGGLVLLLASIGLYGVMSCDIGRRTNEIGLRMALGAEPRQVMAMVLREVAAIIGVGLSLGIAGSFAATRFLASFLYQMKPNDPLTLAAAAGVLAGVALMAAWGPARRAARLDPMAALREE